MTRPDFGKTASDYSRHRHGFPGELFDIFARFGISLDGAQAVDLGTGTGSLARGMARRGAVVTGVDPSHDLTAEARRLDMEWGVAIRHVNTIAEKTRLESNAFDIVTSGQSWWWFDRQAALAEVKRVLRPGGTLAICSFDWIPQPGNVVELTERLIEKHNPSWSMGGGNGFHPDFVSDLKSGGFEDVRAAHEQVDAPYTKESWRGRVRASAGVGASLDPDGVEAFDRELDEALNRFSSVESLPVPHVVYVAVGTTPTGETRRKAAD